MGWLEAQGLRVRQTGLAGGMIRFRVGLRILRRSRGSQSKAKGLTRATMDPFASGVCMTSRSTSRLIAQLAFLSVVLSARGATAQLTPLQDLRRIEATATYRDKELPLSATPDTPFEDEIGWFATPRVDLEEPCPPPSEDSCSVGYAYSAAVQSSVIRPEGGIQMEGNTEGGWGGEPSGSYSFFSRAAFRFRIDKTAKYTLDASVDQGDWDTYGFIGGYVELRTAAGVRIDYVDHGDLNIVARLGPGEYILEGLSSGTAEDETFQGALFSVMFTDSIVPQPLIGHQPSDQEVACGGTAVFSVGTPQAGYTYQWRRNGVPLGNGGHVAGATGSTLTVSGACSGDAGQYDCVVTATVSGVGTVTEPSRLANLSISTATGVALDPLIGVGVTLTAPSPNPFRTATSLRYTVPDGTHLRATVFSVTGARVRSLVDDVVSGSGSVSWDGTLGSGVRAPRGIYFLRVEAGGVRETKKVVIVE